MAKEAKPLHSRPRLGRGLSSLIASSTDLTRDDDQQYQHVTGLPPVGRVHPEPTDQSVLREIRVDQIMPNPYQPRRDFPSQELTELAESIRQQGFIQPLVVVPGGPEAAGEYVLVAGERRLRAARQIGLEAVPCVVREASRQQILEWALIENIQRADLNPMERANAYRQYVDRFGLTQADAAERLGQARATITNHLRLLELHADVQQMLAEGSLSFGHGKVLAALIAEPARQMALARRASCDGLSVRELERLVGGEPHDGTQMGAEAAATAEQGRAPYIRDLEERLSGLLGARVAILATRRGHRGRIVVQYSSLDEFDRITAAMGLKQEA